MTDDPILSAMEQAREALRMVQRSLDRPPGIDRATAAALTALDAAVLARRKEGAEIERLREALAESRLGHSCCLLCGYECPANDGSDEPCDCDAGEWNARIDAALREDVR